VPQGSSATLTITELTTDSFADPVAFSVGGLPSGVTASFEPTAVSGTGQVILTLTANASASPGNYTITITATDTTLPGLSRSKPELVTVAASQTPAAFALTLGNPSVTSFPGGTAAVNVGQAFSDSFDHNVSLSIAGLADGVTASFSPTLINREAVSSLLTLSVGANVSPGTYTLTITGAEAATGFSKTIQLSLVVLPLTVASGALPGGWANQDVGQAASGGATAFSGGVFQLQSSGLGTAGDGSGEQFQFAFTGLEGDGTVTARVLAIANSSASQGIMIRAGLDPSAAFVLLALDNGMISLISRSSYGAQSAYVASVGGGVQLPLWLELIRQGNSFSVATSPDGSNWTPLTDSLGNPVSINVPMDSGVLAGLIDTGSADGSADTAAFDNVSVTSLGAGFALSASSNTVLTSPGAR